MNLFNQINLFNYNNNLLQNLNNQMNNKNNKEGNNNKKGKKKNNKKKNSINVMVKIRIWELTKGVIKRKPKKKCL